MNIAERSASSVSRRSWSISGAREARALTLEDGFSAAAQRALERARLRAADRCSWIEPEDLFWALLDDLDGKVGALVGEAGARLASIAPKFSTSDLDLGQVDVSPNFARVVARASALVGEIAPDEDVGGDDLFAAVIDLWPEAGPLLSASGLDPDKLLAKYHEGRRLDSLAVEAEELPRSADIVERMDVARIVDASANRLREALRVMEDVARFSLDDGLLTASLKECRHQLKQALEFLPPHWLVAARDVSSDVGTSISSSDEHHRTSLAAIIAANSKRAQEAARTLEECAKTESPSASRVLEQLRYRLYGIEKSLGIGHRSRERFSGVRLYWLADPDACATSLDWAIERAIEGGVGAIQLRDKTSSDRELLDLARKVRRWTEKANILFIVNDRPDLARLAGADGVHVGQEEIPIKDVRRIVGPDMLIGVSTHSIEQATEAVTMGADYVGAGPVFPSNTKNFESYPGLDYIREVSKLTSLPTFAIGGIRIENVEEVVLAGAKRIAVSSAIGGARDPRAAALELSRAIESALSAAGA